MGFPLLRSLAFTRPAFTHADNANEGEPITTSLPRLVARISVFRFSLHVSHSGRCRMHEFPCATHRSRNGARASIVRVVYHAQPLSAMVDQQLNLPPNLCADSPLFVLERLRYLQRGGESVSPLRISPLMSHGDSTESNRIKPKPAEQTYSCTNFERREIERVKHAPTDYFLFSRSPPPFSSSRVFHPCIFLLILSLLRIQLLNIANPSIN